MELLQPKVNANGLIDVALLGVAKSVSERVLTPYIGNGTIKSGAIKLVAGSAAHSFAGKAGQIIGGGLVIDGIEDVVVSLMNGSALGGNANAQADW